MFYININNLDKSVINCAILLLNMFLYNAQQLIYIYVNLAINLL
jgi:hypothetical protein